jgi:methyltransferase (TIGR00027 family)
MRIPRSSLIPLRVISLATRPTKRWSRHMTPTRSPWLRTQFALRNRHAEDELAKAVARGMRQSVILGAGLDSFAYRRPDRVRRLQVYEVDHPASQAWKRARVAELGLEVPAGLRYAPVDFERESLPDGLRAAGVDPGAAASSSPGSA